MLKPATGECKEVSRRPPGNTAKKAYTPIQYCEGVAGPASYHTNVDGTYTVVLADDDQMVFWAERHHNGYEINPDERTLENYYYEECEPAAKWLFNKLCHC